MTEMADTQANRAAITEGAGGSRLTTRSGVALDVTRARPDDKDDLRDFFRNVSAEDLRFRFLETVKTVDEAVLRRMVEGGRDVTFLARAMPGGTLVAAATLAVAGDNRKAEVAMSTRHDWKNKGVSWSLLEYVLAFAKAHGFTAVCSLESADNRPAITLEREMGFVTCVSSSDPAETLASKAL